MSTQDQLKRTAAQKALEFVPENAYIGIGTGSTVNFFIEELAESGIRIKGAVSTSQATSKLLKQYGIPEVALNEVDELPVYIDGADEVNHSLQMIKGGGGALLAEKIVASAADKFVCIVDESKYVGRLGKFPLPIEIIPAARSLVSRKLLKFGGTPQLRIGFTTDSGHKIVDVHDMPINEPLKLEEEINRIPGVVENGLFANNPAHVLIIGRPTGAEVIKIGS
ncbi:ribose-5-phosphate isomerase RpiA [Eikenella sp. S3360]|uniref:Ribose-5-phosphate isomerase A n=1 Tax=Eikenella glucosivorans TaxID=2766967 RepID=A0ABS0NB65_9NEIS|nr:ribose-5-phosphate isomerase RpiA [Eikenella glucosivorans]MBH5329524.1 ribose-5-phosphate isomerase RpiA [Eikenella glucosivorans]